MNKLAVNGGKPVRTKPFPSWPVWDDKERKGLLWVLDSGKWWYGTKVAQFEREFAEFQKAKFAVTCVNGTAALELALTTLGIGAGDEVIVPAYTFISTATAVLKVNAIPVFADVSADTFNLDLSKIERLITRRTKAVIPVHFAGLPVDMDRLSKIAFRYKLKVVEDAAHAWGTLWKNQGAGTLGDLGTFSFQASKNITAGEGGMVVTNNQNLAEYVRSCTNAGRVSGKPWYEHYLVGGNYRITEFHAALLLAQLSRLNRQTDIREKNAKYLLTKLQKLPGICLPVRDKRITRRAWHLYNFRYLKSEFGGISKAVIIKTLNAEGIPVNGGYPHPLYQNPLFQQKDKERDICAFNCLQYQYKIDYTRVNCPTAEKLCSDEAIWLRHSVLLGTKKDMDDIVTAWAKLFENRQELQMVRV